MLRTMARGITRTRQVQAVSCPNSYHVKECKRLYTSRGDLPKEEGAVSNHPELKAVNRTPALLQHPKENQHTAPFPKNPSQPLFVNIDQSRQVFSEATWNRMNLVTPLLMSFQARGIRNFVRGSGAGNFNTAVHTLIQAERVLLCTGFNVAENMPETDGPLGTALLAYACFRANKYVVLVADHRNAHLLRTQLFILDPACARNVVIEEVLANSQAPSNLWDDILDRHQPDAVIHTEVPGRNKDGKYLNMRGIPIGDFNAALDEIADVANARGLTHKSVNMSTLWDLSGSCRGHRLHEKRRPTT